MTQPEPNGIRIICAMVETDLDDLELKALTVLLESQGSEDLNLGAGSTADSVAQLVQIRQPYLVFLLASVPQKEDVFTLEHQKIHDALQTNGGKLIIGGRGYASEFVAHNIAGLHERHCSTFKEFASVHYEKVNLKKFEN